MASLGGLSSILRSAKPDVVFLQECPLRDASLKSRAAGLGYVAHQSSLDPSRKLRQLVTLVKRGLSASVTDLVPGNLQGVSLGTHRFLHVHAPSDSHPADKVTRARIFREAGPLFITDSRSLPLVVGDFNCVQEALDTTANFRSKVCRPLVDLLSAFPLVDCFRHFHPSVREYTFRRPGVAPSRLDRAYVPPLLLPSVSSVAHLPTTSDHAALLVSFRTPLGVQMASPPPPRVLLEA
jgi:exonuclease III